MAHTRERGDAVADDVILYGEDVEEVDFVDLDGDGDGSDLVPDGVELVEAAAAMEQRVAMKTCLQAQQFA